VIVSWWTEPCIVSSNLVLTESVCEVTSDAVLFQLMKNCLLVLCHDRILQDVVIIPFNYFMLHCLDVTMNFTSVVLSKNGLFKV
jgi:hypothetical protein